MRVYISSSALKLSLAIFCERRLSNPKKEGLAKQTQVFLLGGLSFEDARARAYPVSIKLGPLTSRFSWKKAFQKQLNPLRESLTADFIRDGKSRIAIPPQPQSCPEGVGGRRSACVINDY